VTISGLGIQVSDPSPGGQGGAIAIQAHLDVNLTDGRNEAKGASLEAEASTAGR